MDEGWVKTFRKLKSWQWYKKSDMVHLFIHLLLSANHKDGTWMNQPIKRGQVVTGRRQLSYETGISERAIRTIINRLISTNELTVKTTNKFSIITICNYDSYQGDKIKNDQQDDQQDANKRPTKQRKSTTNKNEYKNNKEEKKYKEYKLFVEKYFDWFKERNNGLIPKMSAIEGKNLNQIITYLKGIYKKESGAGREMPEESESILNMWQYILSNWSRIDSFYQDKTRLRDINSNLQNIITQLKNGTAKNRGTSFSDIDRIVDGSYTK